MLAPHSFKQKTQRTYRNGGYIALTTTLILVAVLIFIISSIALQVIDELQVASSQDQSIQARYLAQACGEIALQEFSNDPNYTASGGAGDTYDEFPNGECVIDLADDCTTEDADCTDGWKVIRTSAVVGDNEYTAKTQIIVSTTTSATSPSVVVDSWDEWAEF